MRDSAVTDALRFRAIFGMTSVGMVECDASTASIVLANAKFSAMLGYAMGELEHTNFFHLLDPSDNGADRDGYDRMIRGEAAEWVAEMRCLKRDGQSFWVRASFRLIADLNGSPHSSVGIIEDIDEQKNARGNEVREVIKRTEALSSLSQHLIGVAEEEKASLARELHDEVGSSLAAISMDMGWILNKLKKENPELVARQERAIAGIHAALDIKRRIVDGLRPLALEHFGLEVALRSHCDAFAEQSGLPVTMDAPEELLPPDPATSLVIFRVVQECLTNISKHAKATRVNVELEESREGIIVRVTDDGKGIPPDLMNRTGAHGILGMRERVAHLGGVLSVEPGPGEKGTVVEVRLPLDQEEKPQEPASSSEAL